ncbi:MAG TPA: PAS domain S-box protein, partial [Acidimicrobiales bacterium]|nr:PAS domain S-box protein [Acidimicrobiales bacterium]
MPGSVDDEHLAEAVRAAHDMVVVFDTTGRIVYVNDAVATVLGGDPGSYLETNIVDYVHPEDLERALATLEMSATVGAVPGVAFFRIRRPDGAYASLELTTGSALVGGGRDLRFVVCRKSQTRLALEEILRRLMEGSDLANVMRAVCDVFEWQLLGAGVAIVWRQPDREPRWVSTGLPEELAGADMLPGGRQDGPKIERTIALDLKALPAAVRALAAERGFGGYWIEPIERQG